MEKEEFLRLLPKLIREDDEVKGAIISALSGVMATKDDIQRVIDRSERNFKRLQRRMNYKFAKMDERFAKMDERFAKMDERFDKMDERINKNQEILISHSKSLKYIVENMPNLQSLRDIDIRMKRLENLSATQYKTLDGKIETKFKQVNEKFNCVFDKIDDLKKIIIEQNNNK